MFKDVLQYIQVLWLYKWFFSLWGLLSKLKVYHFIKYTLDIYLHDGTYKNKEPWLESSLLTNKIHHFVAKFNSVIENRNNQFLEQNNLAGMDLNKHLVAQFFISVCGKQDQRNRLLFKFSISMWENIKSEIWTPMCLYTAHQVCQCPLYWGTKMPETVKKSGPGQPPKVSFPV